jgi:hypothetical protein
VIGTGPAVRWDVVARENFGSRFRELPQEFVCHALTRVVLDETFQWPGNWPIPLRPIGTLRLETLVKMEGVEDAWSSIFQG